ncbi:MAG TPA: hypothetical protein VK194_03570 [Candidatus Deferrimicrobium sp.]|nr:hypothetical protein [Candidatus Deferrimicrobium sp.]
MSVRLRVGLVAAVLGLDLLALHAQLETAIWSAACLERAKDELVSCLAPPDWWSVALSGTVALGLAAVLGFVLARARMRRA